MVLMVQRTLIVIEDFVLSWNNPSSLKAQRQPSQPPPQSVQRYLGNQIHSQLEEQVSLIVIDAGFFTPIYYKEGSSLGKHSPSFIGEV